MAQTSCGFKMYSILGRSLGGTGSQTALLAGPPIRSSLNSENSLQPPSLIVARPSAGVLHAARVRWCAGRLQNASILWAVLRQKYPFCEQTFFLQKQMGCILETVELAGKPCWINRKRFPRSLVRDLNLPETRCRSRDTPPSFRGVLFLTPLFARLALAKRAGRFQRGQRHPVGRCVDSKSRK